MSIHYDEKGKIFTDIIHKNAIQVTVQTTRFQIHGSLHVREGERLKDELNRSEDFLALTDAEVYDDSGKLLHASRFITVNRDQIVWLYPDSERKE